MISAATLFNRLMARTRLRHLQLILHVAELGSVQHASELLGISQSAATKLIADVERVLETRLFERHARGMRTTFACRDLLPLLRRVIAMMASCARSAAASSAGIDGTIRIGSTTGGMAGVVNQTLSRFLSDQPEARVELIEDAAPVILGQYADGELDIVVAREPPQLASDSCFVPLLKDMCVITVRPEHPLAGKRRVRAKQMLAYPWILPPLESQAYNAFEAFFSQCGSTPLRRPLSTRSLGAIIRYLETSDAILLGPFSFMRGELDSGAIVRLDCILNEPLPYLGLVHRLQPRNRSVAVFQEYLLNKRTRFDSTIPSSGRVDC